MPLYENVFIARQDISGAQVDQLADTFTQLIAEQGGEVRAGTPDAMATWLKDSTKRWGDIIREAGIKGE